MIPLLLLSLLVQLLQIPAEMMIIMTCMVNGKNVDLTGSDLQQAPSVPT